MFHPLTWTLGRDRGVPQGSDSGCRRAPPPHLPLHLPVAADCGSCWWSLVEVKSFMPWDSCLGWQVFPWAARKRTDRLYLQLLSGVWVFTSWEKVQTSNSPSFVRAAVHFLHTALTPVLLTMDWSYLETQSVNSYKKMGLVYYCHFKK